VIKKAGIGWFLLLLVAATGLLTGCQTMQYKPLATVDYVDLPRYMGDWYVIANIPTPLEKNAYNAVESYRFNEDGTIATTFTIRKGGLEGPLKEYHPTGYVQDKQSNAVWGMQFIWPIKADYRIIYLTDDYSQTVVGRNKRDYVWIMARTPDISDSDYRRLVHFIEKQGYDTSELRQVPQRHE
jgi:apolipoprotein D and lipocalin family protein